MLKTKNQISLELGTLKIYNTFNNINYSIAAANHNITIADKKGEQNCKGKSEQDVIKTVREHFKNQISERKIIELIRNSSMVNIKNQLQWFSYRDHSWARKGPVVAFITYCQQELGEPEGFKAKTENEGEIINQLKSSSRTEKTIVEKQRLSRIERREKYGNPEKYDSMLKEIDEKVISESVVARGIFKSCFIGNIRTDGMDRILVIDTPNLFCRDWLERNFGDKILKYFGEKPENVAKVEFVSF